MTFFSRNPRYTLALLVLLCFTTVTLFNNPFSYQSPFKGYSVQRGLRTVDIIRQTEADYQSNVLKERKNLITKFGPTVNDVSAWPRNWEFYTLWDFFIPGFQCPHKTSRIGTFGDGGKWVCGLERIENKRCVIYSFGINGESSFEAEVMKRAPGCEVWGYDFSVTSFGPELSSRSLASRSHFFPWALGPIDNHGSNVETEMWTLKSLMEHNGHDFIDILKIDIEGAEFASLGAFFDHYEAQPSVRSAAESPIDFSPTGRGSSLFPGKPLPFGQMQIELHPRESEEMSKAYSNFPAFLAFWEKMERLGLRPFWTEPNLVYVNLIGGKPDLSEYSFINIRGNHELVVDAPDFPHKPHGRD